MNAVERVVAEVFADALEREEPPGPDDSIFSLGGDSLSAVRAALALERRFDVEVPPELMEEGLSVRELAHWIEAALAGSPRVAP